MKDISDSHDDQGQDTEDLDLTDKKNTTNELSSKDLDLAVGGATRVSGSGAQSEQESKATVYAAQEFEKKSVGRESDKKSG